MTQEKKRIAIFGATSAIACAAAKLWAAKGAEFVLVARNEERLQSVGQDLRGRGAGAVECITADLAQCAHHAAIVEAVWQKSVDIVLVAFGVLTDQARAEKDVNYAVSELNVNFVAPTSLLLCLANRFEQQGHGVVAVIGSVAGDRGRKSNAVYGSAKAGLAAFLSGLRGRLSARGIAVITVKPGFVDTPMTSHLKKGLLFASSDTVGMGIIRAVERRSSVVYLPWFWRPIMTILAHVPERLFHKLPL